MNARLLSLGNARLLSLGFVVLAIAAPAAGAAGARVSAHLTRTSFEASQASAVKLVYRFSKTSRRFGYVLALRSGSRWRTVTSATHRGRYAGSHSVTVAKLFAKTPITVGRYRLTLSADGGSTALAFTVAAVKPRAGGWVGTSLSGPVSGGGATATGLSFAVLPDRTKVGWLSFSYTMSGYAQPGSPPGTSCSEEGTSSMESDISWPIVDGAFSTGGLSGPWTGSAAGEIDGTFDTPTTAHGTASMSATLGGACAGHGSTGSFSWTAATR